MKRKIFFTGSVIVAGILPLISLAADTTEQTCGTVRNLTGLFSCALGLVGYGIGLLFILAIFFFLLGITKFLWKGADNATDRAEGRKFMIWGIVALFVMVAVWGLVQVLERTFGFGGGAQFNTQQTGNKDSLDWAKGSGF